MYIVKVGRKYVALGDKLTYSASKAYKFNHLEYATECADATGGTVFGQVYRKVIYRAKALTKK